MNMNDVFTQDAFGVVQLTAAINEVDFVPGRLGQMGLFMPSFLSTTSLAVERVGDTLKLITSTERGAPADKNTAAKRKMHNLKIPHIPIEDTIPADEVQNVRAFGSGTELEAIQDKVNERLASMSRKIDATIEHLRIGAVKGVILDGDGTTTLYDLFSEFGVSQITEIDFDLDNADPASGAVTRKCNEVIRNIEDELGGATYTGVHGMVSSQFFDDLVAHKEVRETFLYQQGGLLRERSARRTVFYGGITFEEYRGKVGNVSFVADNKAHFFPVGVPDLFIEAYAPADFIETVNTVALPKYAKQAVDSRFQRYVELHAQSNPLPICTRPRVLIKAKRT